MFVSDLSLGFRYFVCIVPPFVRVARYLVVIMSELSPRLASVCYQLYIVSWSQVRNKLLSVSPCVIHHSDYSPHSHKMLWSWKAVPLFIYLIHLKVILEFIGFITSIMYCASKRENTVFCMAIPCFTRWSVATFHALNRQLDMATGSP